MPLLDNTEACLKEITFPYESLQANGVTLLTSYGQSYLGSPQFRPIWDELDRRDAVVFVHPTMDLHQAPLAHPFVPPLLVHYHHEMTCTAVHLILSNTVLEYPNCEIIHSHGGSTLPYMATRVACMAEDGNFSNKSAQDFLKDI